MTDALLGLFYFLIHSLVCATGLLLIIFPYYWFVFYFGEDKEKSALRRRFLTKGMSYFISGVAASFFLYSIYFLGKQVLGTFHQNFAALSVLYLGAILVLICSIYIIRSSTGKKYNHQNESKEIFRIFLRLGVITICSLSLCYAPTTSISSDLSLFFYKLSLIILIIAIQEWMIYSKKEPSHWAKSYYLIEVFLTVALVTHVYLAISILP